MESERKFKTKIREKLVSLVTTNYDAIIPEETQFETVKTMTDKIDDIFDHTDQKVNQVMTQLTKTYNRKKSNLVDPKED